ncbi:hypothetical protein LCGC14_1988610 [marine sediment metagenome]|uniref:N-acetylmuramoyl-L-alanine amidase domain-containing protein n=1 Tax=marine sediment metagenome TaxID=412755 RepID=A0A0F9I3S9_9ZZZZ
MSVGACVLILMETDPASPPGPVALSAMEARRVSVELDIVRHTGGVPLQFIKWANVVVHDMAADGDRGAAGCHFLVDSDGTIRPTELWRRQREGDHIRVPGYNFNANSIGVRLMVDSARSRPPGRQMDALVRLLRAIQVACAIPRDHVYLHSDLARPGCPGKRFAGTSFRRRLISPTR